MTSRGRRGARLSVLLAVGAALVLPAPAASADDGTPVTYPGPEYTRLIDSPTESESQSKLWFQAGAWWALIAEPTGRSVRVSELMPDHSWRPTSAVVNTNTGQVGDALREGDSVHVTSRSRTGDLEYVRLAFDEAARDYRVEVKEIVTTAGGLAPATIARDGDGRLWIGYANGRNAVALYSDDEGVTWSDRVLFPVTGEDGATEVGVMVAYDDRVGFMWSSQRSDSFEFASHRDGDPPTTWARESALTGAGQADNHISLVRVPGDDGDTLIAAVKTAQDEAGAEAIEYLVKVLVRTPDGEWSEIPAATIGDELTDPLLQVDLTNETLYLIAAAESGDIVVKQSPLDEVSFDDGLGQLFMLAGDRRRLAGPTGTKEPVDAASGLVVLADNTTERTYRHAEVPLTGAAPDAATDDQTPPGAPEGLRAGAVSSQTVVLSWSRATDGNEWVPAGDAPSASGYIVTRDGEEVDRLTATSFRDDPRSGSESDEVTVTYQVQAVDEAGNRSEPVEISVTLPPAPSRLPVYLGIAALVLGGLAAAYRVFRHALLDRRMATGPAPVPEEPELTAVGPGSREG